MQRWTGRAAVLAACTTILGLTSLPAAASASTPPLVWQGATRIGVQCLIHSETRGHQAELGAAICERVRRIASRGAPAPVQLVQLGDPALVSPDTVTLLVHGLVQPHERREALAFTIRPFRASSEQTAVLYGSLPRIAPVSASGAGGPALDSALAASLAEILPWQQRPQGPRRLGRP